jgi:hypothetical protein
MRFDPKISKLEEREDLNSISMDELHGIFIAYEMRTEQENLDVKEATFKASKRSKKKGKKKKNNIAAIVTSRKMMKKWSTLSKD